MVISYYFLWGQLFINNLQMPYRTECRIIGWLCCCLLLSPVQASAQSFAEALQAGQRLKLEWIQQVLHPENGQVAGVMPLFPEELAPGESELRVGVHLKSAGEDIVAEVDYVYYLALPAPAETPYRSGAEELLPPPVILDTRFQDAHFHPQLFRLNVLTQQRLPVTCQAGAYRSFLEQLERAVSQTAATSSLLEEQVVWLDGTELLTALSATSLATFFCRMLETYLPEQERPVKLQTHKQDDMYRVDYLQVDHPPQMCVLKGTIQSPATDKVRIQFFREGNWLDYWQDTIVPLNKEGRFALAFPRDHAGIITMSHGYQTMRFYLQPADTLDIRTNANAFYRDMEITGTGRAENEFLLDFYHELRGDTLFRSYDVDLLEQDHAAFFRKVRVKEARELALLNRRAPALRPAFVALMEHDIILEYASVQWEAAYRFMAEKGVALDPELVRQLQQKAAILYRLPPGKHFDFAVEEYLTFQFYLLQQAYQLTYPRSSDDFTLAQLLPGKETFVRHSVMQLFRQYTDLGALTESGQWRLNQLLAITRDTQLVREMSVFMDAGAVLPEDRFIRTLQIGEEAPSWRFRNQEGVQVGLQDFAGKKMLLHIGWVDNLDMAMADMQSLREAQEQLPEIVHLLAANSKDRFTRGIAGKDGLFVFVPAADMDSLAEDYFIDNRSNHYFLIGENGMMLANHYDLLTAKKLRGTWEKVADLPAETSWTASQWLRFWRSLGIGALVLLVLGGIIFWRRWLINRREQRRRQLLEVELRGIRSQMNPHFLFNAMSSIQNLMRKREQEKADQYLGQFAGLMRKTLRNTAEEFIPLVDEIEMLEQYCSLESLRHPFRYEFQIDGRVDAHNTYIPSMILQPIIENAIIHGLAPQHGAKKLVVEISPGTEGLKCTVTDNGIGVIAARKQLTPKAHQSVGMTLVRQRLALLGLKGEEHLTIKDLGTLEPPGQGTQVALTIPIEQ